MAPPPSRVRACSRMERPRTGAGSDRIAAKQASQSRSPPTRKERSAPVSGWSQRTSWTRSCSSRARLVPSSRSRVRSTTAGRPKWSKVSTGRGRVSSGGSRVTSSSRLAVIFQWIILRLSPSR